LRGPRRAGESPGGSAGLGRRRGAVPGRARPAPRPDRGPGRIGSRSAGRQGQARDVKDCKDTKDEKTLVSSLSSFLSFTSLFPWLYRISLLAPPQSIAAAQPEKKTR